MLAVRYFLATMYSNDDITVKSIEVRLVQTVLTFERTRLRRYLKSSSAYFYGCC